MISRCNRILNLMLSVALTVFMLSCQHKDIACPGLDAGDGIKVLFDWTSTPDAAPDGMTVIFFPLDADGRIWHFEIAGREGGRVKLPCGHYIVLAYNNDTYDIYFRDTGSISTYEAYTLSASMPDASSVPLPDEPLRRQPDEMYSAMATDLHVTPCGITYVSSGRPEGDCLKGCSQSVLRLYPRRITCRYTCMVEDVENISSIRSIEAVLTGMAPAETVADGVPCTGSVAVPFKMSLDGDDGLCGRFNSFGRNEGNGNMLMLYVRLKNNDKKLFKVDVTSQAVNAPDPKNVLLKVRGLHLPEPEPSDTTDVGGGFDVGVEDWETIIIDLTVG